MKNQTNKTYLVKIIIGIAVGFASSQILISMIFMSPTGPQPQNIGFIQGRIESLITSIQSIFKTSPDKRTSEERLQIINEAKNQMTQPVMSGISVYKDEAQSLVYTEYNIREIQWNTTELTLADGRHITVRYPYGETAPPSSLFQN